MSLQGVLRSLEKINKKLSFYLVIVGLVNWGIVGFFGIDLIDYIVGFVFKSPTFRNTIYVWIGFSVIEYIRLYRSKK